MLQVLGENPAREGLERTPERSDRAMKFLMSGYAMDLNRIVNGALYNVKSDGMVIVKDIEFFSLCEHHMLPFFGKVHVAYLPKDRVIGLSKIPRIVDMYSRRLQVQERLTQQISGEHPAGAESAWGRSGGGGAALLYDDARRGKTSTRVQ